MQDKPVILNQHGKVKKGKKTFSFFYKFQELYTLKIIVFLWNFYVWTDTATKNTTLKHYSSYYANKKSR